uniref:(northern house mosquito) hypothetical protein n=1 Tax=Culex pipiens TaxID=7175 RepID=A0A8D8K4R6_CULPI
MKFRMMILGFTHTCYYCPSGIPNQGKGIFIDDNILSHNRHHLALDDERTLLPVFKHHHHRHLCHRVGQKYVVSFTVNWVLTPMLILAKSTNLAGHGHWSWVMSIVWPLYQWQGFCFMQHIFGT